GANTFRQYAGKDGLGNALWSSFAEDRQGNIWIGSLASSEVTRYANGRFTLFKEADGLPKGEIRSIYSDRAGRLWMASGSSGLVRIDDPGAAHPRFASYG